MPFYGDKPNWKELQKRRTELRRKHDAIVRSWKAGELSWNEYVRQEKKYRS